MMDKIAIVDTTFARFDMGGRAQNGNPDSEGNSNSFVPRFPESKIWRLPASGLSNARIVRLRLRSECPVVRPWTGSAPTKLRSA